MSAPETILNRYMADSLALLRRAGIVLPEKARASLYHHRGAEKIYETGALFLNIVDRDYCKSYVVMLPGQRYPAHFHKIKNESMYVLYGELNVKIDGEDHLLRPGQIVHVERGQDHSFSTAEGAVFEEISTMYMPNDSVYLDEAIRRAPYSLRRTVLNEKQWEAVTHAQGEILFPV